MSTRLLCLRATVHLIEFLLNFVPFFCSRSNAIQLKFMRKLQTRFSLFRRRRRRFILVYSWFAVLYIESLAFCYY